MTARVRSIDCPSCGAPLQMPSEGQLLFKCQYCGTTLEDLTTGEQRQSGQRPTVVIRSARVASVPPAVVARPDRVGRLVGCIVAAALVLGVVAALVASGVLATGGRSGGPPEGLRVYSFGLARLVPAEDESSPDIVGVTRNSDDTNRMVYVDWEGEQPLRWQSEPLGEGADYLYNPVVAGRAAVYLAYKTTLVAFDRQTGAIAWQATLSDEVSNICRDCLQVFGDWLVALTADGVLHGVNTTTGSPAWSVRLNETPRQLMNLAGKAGTLDEVDGAVGINVYEPATGALVERLVPQCPNEVFENDPQELSIYDAVLVSAAGTEFYVPISEWRPGCVQRWDAATLTMVWQATVPAEAIDSLGREPYLLTGRELFTTDGHALYRVGLAEGVFQQVISDEDHNLAPLAAGGDVLLVLAERTRGTRHYLLWGVDPSEGELRWQLDPAAAAHDDGGSDVVHSDGTWSAAVMGDHAVVMEAFSDPGILSFTTLGLSDGAHTGTNAFALSAEDSTYWLQVLGWDAGRVYLEMDHRLWVLDVTSGEEIARWPR